MADRTDVLFWVAFAFFGFTSLAAGAFRVTGGDASLATWGQLLGGALVAGAATLGLLGGDAVTGDATDVSPLVQLLAIVGAFVYVVGVGLTVL